MTKVVFMLQSAFSLSPISLRCLQTNKKQRTEHKKVLPDIQDKIGLIYKTNIKIGLMP